MKYHDAKLAALGHQLGVYPGGIHADELHREVERAVLLWEAPRWRAIAPEQARAASS